MVDFAAVLVETTAFKEVLTSLNRSVRRVSRRPCGGAGSGFTKF
jgi:hypothetical protein